MYEAYLLQLCKYMPLNQVAKMSKPYDAKLWNLLDCYIQKGLCEANHTAVTCLGIDETSHQLCVVHQIRNSLKHIGSVNQKEFMKDLKTVYQTETLDLAAHNLKKLDQKWGAKYPIVLKSWKTNWDLLTAYFKYSPDIRRLIYTTNPIEGFHRQVRKYTKTKGAFTSENALLKLLYCAITNITNKWTMPVQNWALTISQLVS